MKMTLPDRFVAWKDPEKGLVRHEARKKLNATYEAVSGSTASGKRPLKENKLPTELAQLSQRPLAQQARWFEQNTPLVSAALDELAKNVIGPDGLTAHPQVKTKEGKPATKLNEAIKRLYDEAGRTWCMDGRMDRADSEILIARTVPRDGEIFSRIYEHNGHDYLGRVPFGIELFECDHVDAALTDRKLNIVNGFQLGEYNRTVGYYFTPDLTQFVKKPVLLPEREVNHIAWKVRASALRGLSKLAPALLTIFNLKEFEDAIQIGRLVASRITLVHEKTKGGYVPGQDGDNEEFDEKLEFGCSNVVEIGKDEKVSVIESAKGAGDTATHIQHQQRSITSTMGVNNSSVTGVYNKSFSAQRQELIDRWASYIMMRSLVTRQHVRPCYERWLNAAIISAVQQVGSDIDWSTIYDVQFIGPVMPWIDPLKEANSLKILKQIGMLPLTMALAQRGLDVSKILEMYSEEREKMEDLGLMDLIALIADENVNKLDEDDDAKTKKTE